MDFAPLAYVMIALSFPLWAWTQALSNALESAKKRKSWWGALLLSASPFVLGIVICTIPGALDFMLSLFGWDGPPTSGGLQVLGGVFAGTTATTLHALGVRRLIEKKVKASVKDRVNMLLVLLAFALAGCASWPTACKLADVNGERVRRCSCAHLKWQIDPLAGKPAPAGVVTPICDGLPLPLKVAGENIEVPQ